jgi:MoxR-like ATPase
VTSRELPPSPANTPQWSAPTGNDTATALSAADVAWFTDTFARVVDNVRRRLHGKGDQIGFALIALISEGHVLLEDVPGVGKTTLARSLAESIGGSWGRVQFTPDLLPSDITGSSVYQTSSESFRFIEGPVFANILVGDEINRASPKTQSALLEVMEERQVTADGISRAVPRPFVVIATQNPIEMEGTYSLPEAQLDRFLIRMSMGYPDAAAEAALATQRTTSAGPLPAVIGIDDIHRMIALSSAVRAAPQLVQYIVSLVHATRRTADIRLGASPRGTIGLLRASQTLALAEGRPYVVADDVKRLAVAVLGHRLLLAPDAALRGLTAERVIVDLMARLPVPGGSNATR